MKHSLWNRLLSVFLAAAMLISLNAVPLTAWAAEEESPADNTCGENATWTLEDGVLTISGTGSTTPYEDESTTPWADERDSITKLVIESGITGIGDSLARDCTNLVDVEIADTVTSVGGHAFSGCTSLTQIELPEGITRIGYSAFANTGLTVIAFPSTVAQVEWNVFDGCTALSRIVFTGDAPTFMPDAFVNVTTIVSYPENYGTWTDDVLQQYGGNITWEAYTLGAGGGDEESCTEGEACLGDATMGLHICAVHFPDYTMECCVRNDVDTNYDGYLSEDEIAAVTELHWMGYGIERLDGIQYFTNLTHLVCGENRITSLDLSANTKLQYLQCIRNQLTSLDLSGNTELIDVDCGGNQLTELNVGGLTKLENLSCYENDLTALDLSTNTALIMLNCNNNELLWLNLDSQSKLEVLNHDGQYHYCEFEYTQQDDVVLVDMAQFVGKENIGRIVPDMEGATYDPTTGIMTFSGLPSDFPYCYEIECPSRPGEWMWVVVHYGCEHWWEMSGCDRTCTLCGETQFGALHEFGPWTISKLPTAEEDGVAYIQCRNCGQQGENPIPAGTAGIVENSWNNDCVYDIRFADLAAATDVVLTEEERQAAEQSLAWLTLWNRNDRSYDEVTADMEMHLMNTLEEGEEMLDAIDLQLFKQIGTAEPQRVTEILDAPVIISMRMEGFPCGEGITYQVVFPSNDGAMVLDAVYDGEILYFETDRFGVCAITVMGADFGGGEEPDHNEEAEPFVTDCPDSTEDSLHICQHNFPDENFRAFLLSNCDHDSDGYLSRIEAGVHELNCENWQIASLEGLRHFSNLRSLNCGVNALTELDLTGNTKLQRISSFDNQLTKLNVSGLTELEMLDCGNNQLKELDVSTNTKLVQLYCRSNQLTALDVSHNAELRALSFDENKVSSVDISMLTKLENINCMRNELTALDLSNKPNLEIVYCAYNQITELDVSASTNLRELHFDYNQLSAIDLSNNRKLQYLNCGGNQITQLDVSHLTGLVSLICFGNSITQLDISGMTKLEQLDCDRNLLKVLDVSANTALLNLNAGYNLLEELNVSSNTDLQALYLDSNLISQIDLSRNTKLQYLNLRNNLLTEVDVTMLTELEEVLFCMNYLTQLDVSKNTKLQNLSFPENQVSEIDLSNNPDLLWLVAYDNPIKTIDVSANTKLRHLSLSNTDLTELDLRNNTALEELGCMGCKLRTLDLSNQTALYMAELHEQHISAAITYTEEDGRFAVNMAQFVGAENVDHVSVECNGGYDAENGIAYYDYPPNEIWYYYRVDFPNVPGDALSVIVRDECEHSWEGLSCQQTCALCGEKGNSHEYGPWTVTELPTMTTEGTLTKTCAGCGTIMSEWFPAGTMGIVSAGRDNAHEGRLTHPTAAGNVVLTDAEKAALENGALAVLSLDCENLRQMEAKREAILIHNCLKDWEDIIEYLDLRLYKQLDLNPVEQISNTGDMPVSISLIVPEWVRNECYTYRIIRVVNDEATVLNPESFDITSGELTFFTDEFGVFALTVIRPEDVNGQLGPDMYWYLNREGTLSIDGNGDMPNYTDCTETPWYPYAERILQVYVNPGVTSVGQYAFSMLPKLKEVYVAESVTTIWNYAFQSSGYLQSVNLFEGLTDIYVGAFEGCAALKHINLPESLESICEYAFAASGLKEIDIPANVTMVSDYAFSDCANLATVIFWGNAPDYLGENVFQNVTAGVYYPEGDDTWTEEVMQQYGGELTWDIYQGPICPEMPLGEAVYAEVEQNGTAIYKFIPNTTDLYHFFSNSEGDPYGILYNENMEPIFENDDDNSLNFGIRTVLEAGHVYYLGTRFYNGEAGTIQIQLNQIHDCYTEIAIEGTCQEQGLRYHICRYCGQIEEETYYGDHSYGADNVCVHCGANGPSSEIYPALPLDMDVTVGIAEGETVIFRFTPQVTDKYFFYSLSEYGTYGVIYNGELEILNDYSSSAGFGMEMFMVAGETYYVGIRFTEDQSGTAKIGIRQIHIYITETVTEATCVEAGLVRHFCEYCGHTVEEPYYGDHSYGEDNTCDICGHINITSGICGDDLTWDYTDGVLTISGTGAMYDFEENGAPWQQYMDEVDYIELSSELTYVGSYAFYNYTVWAEFYLPVSLTGFGAYAFQAKDGEAPTQLVFHGDAPSMDFYAFGNNPGYVSYPYSNPTWTEAVKEACGENIILKPYDDLEQFVDMGAAGHDLIWILEKDGTLRLEGNGKMEAYYAADMPWAHLWDQIQRVELPEGLENIRHLSFCGITQLTTITIPSTVTAMGNHAISGCENMESIYFTGDAPAFEEMAFANTTATAYYPAGNPTWTEDVMQNYGGDITWMSYEMEEEVFTIGGTSVSLGDSLDMHFFVDPFYVDDSCYAELIRYYSDGRGDDIVIVPYSQWNALDDGRLYITYGNIAAKEMGDYVSIEIFNGDGEVISQLYVDSVKAYATRMLDKAEVVANEELRTLYVDMLNYGAAAQAQFGYNVTMPANDLLTEEQLAWATDSYETESNLVSGTGRAGTALTLKNRITLDLVFSNVYLGQNLSQLRAEISYTDHYGNPVNVTVSGEHFKPYTDRYTYISVPGLSVADYGQMVTCVIYDASGNALVSATDSIEGYAHRMAGKLPQIVDAIMKFGTSAYNYFH